MSGNRTADISAMIASTQTISSKVKPCFGESLIFRGQMFERDVGRYPTAAFLAIRSVGDDVIGAVVARGAVDVGMIPGIVGNIAALEIRSIPGSHTRCRTDQGRQSFRGRGKAPGVEIIKVERTLEALQLDPGGLDLGFAEIVEHAWTDQAHDQADDGDHDQHFDQRKARLVLERPPAMISAPTIRAFDE